MMSREASLAGLIREAIASDEYDKALDLWNEYTAGLEEDARHNRLTEAQIQEMGALVEWSSGVLVSTRARAREILSSVCAAGKYSDPAPRNEPRIVRVNL